ncbi:MAG TPA: PEP-CTERM sorting domain-containing protein [Rhodocyclaceae bacterium]|nr:PEP-CTERM sorting domain-containing protein [Rhodocyclaceae bacterium]
MEHILIESLLKKGIMMKTKFKTCAATATVISLSVFGMQSASADTIAIQGFWGGAGNVSSLKFSGVDYHDGNTYSFTENGGSGGFKVANLTTGGPSFQGWCVDIFHNFNFGNPGSTSDTQQTASQIFSLLGATRAAKIQTDLVRLYTAEHSLIDGTNSTANNSAAFQLAIWEIVNENSSTYDLSTGGLQAGSSSTGYATAQSWLTSLNTTPSFGAGSQYKVSFWNVNDGNGLNGGTAPPTWGAQDLAVFAPVPEPETYAMLMAGLGLIGVIARRRKAV